MKKIYLPILLLSLVSLLPVVVGTLLFHYHQHLSFKTMNHGTLINPPFSLSSSSSQESLPLKKWKILYEPNHCCDATCDKLTFTLHQLRLVLGKDSNRLNLVLALDKTCQVKDAHDFQILTQTQKARVQFQQFMRQQGHSDFTAGNKIYLIDPLNNIFMVYPSTTSPMNILKDIKRVLEVSQIG